MLPGRRTRSRRCRCHRLAARRGSRPCWCRGSTRHQTGCNGTRREDHRTKYSGLGPCPPAGPDAYPSITPVRREWYTGPLVPVCHTEFRLGAILAHPSPVAAGPGQDPPGAVYKPSLLLCACLASLVACVTPRPQTRHSDGLSLAMGPGRHPQDGPSISNTCLSRSAQKSLRMLPRWRLDYVPPGHRVKQKIDSKIDGKRIKLTAQAERLNLAQSSGPKSEHFT